MTVTLELLFPHLDDLIQTPADVQRLNEAILQLAVQGKLVPQDPQDEPAGELLKRIEKEKAQLVVEGKIGKEKPQTPVDEDEMLFALPLGWEWARFTNVANIATNSTDPTLYPHLPHIAPDNIEKFSGKLLEYRTVIEDGVTSIKHRFYPGQILYSKIRPNLSKVVIVDFEGLCSADMYPIDAYINARYLLNYMLSGTFIGMATKTDTRVAMPKINQDTLSKIVVAVPPLAEQKRIGVKVDELFAQTRALEAKLRRAQEAIVVVNRAVLHHLHHAADHATFQHAAQILGDHFDLLYTDPRPVTDLRQTILQLAVQGKLVPQDPHDEPAGELLKRIEKESKETQPISTIAEEEQPYALPESWEWVKFGTICEHRLGKMLDNQKNKGDYRPYLRNLNVQWDRIDFDDIQVMRFEPQEFDEYRLLPGDLLICEGGEPGRCAIWHHAETEMMFQKAIHRARPYCGITPRYLLFHLRADADGGRLANYFTGATIQHFTGRALANYCIALPPLAEQKRIVAKVDELLARCATLERKLGQAQVAGRQLTAAVLHRVVG